MATAGLAHPICCQWSCQFPTEAARSAMLWRMTEWASDKALAYAAMPAFIDRSVGAGFRPLYNLLPAGACQLRGVA